MGAFSISLDGSARKDLAMDTDIAMGVAADIAVGTASGHRYRMPLWT